MDSTIVVAFIGAGSTILVSSITYYRGKLDKDKKWKADMCKKIEDETVARELWQLEHEKYAEESMKEIIRWQKSESKARLEHEKRDIRGKILNIHNRAVDKGYLGAKDWEYCHEQYDRYKSEELNGNSFVDELMEHIDYMHKQGLVSKYEKIQNKTN